jgi:nucleotide-binding universal stress UspA family protein
MDDTNGSIVVGYDGSPDADLALEWAAQTALLEHRAVSVAIIDDPGALPGVAWMPEDYWMQVEQQATRLLDKAGFEDGDVIRRHGAVVPALIALAHDASLVVLGSRGHSRVGEILIGSVSQHLAGHAPCPVAVIRPTAGPDVSRIVVGLDGSRSSEAALTFACRRAQLTGEKVSAVRAARFGPVHLDWLGDLPPSLGTFLEEEEQELAKSLVDAVAGHPDVTIESEFITLRPAQALVDTSRDASLVVVGSRGRNAFAGMLLGSVSHEVLHRAHCPVVVMR